MTEQLQTTQSCPYWRTHDAYKIFVFCDRFPRVGTTWQ